MRISEVTQPSLLTRIFYKVGERMFGMVPTPERVMAHRWPLMVGLGTLYGSIEWCGAIERPLRALIKLHVARVRGAAY